MGESQENDGFSRSKSFLKPELARAGRELAFDAADRLRDIPRAEKAICHPDNVEPIYGATMWAPGTLSHGMAGTSLMFSLLAAANPAFRAPAHEHLSRAAAGIQWNSYAGLMGGPAGVLAAAQGVTGDRDEYHTLRRKLGDWVAHAQIEHIDSYEQSSANGVTWHTYDFINGLSGTLRVLLDEDSAAAEKAVNRTARFLCQSILRRQRTEYPGWWVPAELQPTQQDKEAYPLGDLNLGLGHGVPGAVSALVSIVEKVGPSDDILEALDFATSWICRWRQESNDVSYWPARIPAQYEREPDEAPPFFTRAAWCYGTPGVAAVLTRAARALGSKDLQQHALETLLSHLRAPLPEWRLDGPTFCHGSSGTLQVLYRMWKQTGDERLLPPANDIAARIIDEQTSPQSPLLFQHWVPDSPLGWRAATSHKYLDVAGLLEGSSGVAAVLYGVSEDGPEEGASWDRVFGLS